MSRFIQALLLTMALAGSILAQTPDADPMSSSECVNAREELERALGETGAARQARADRIARARQQAVQACLGRDSGNRQRSGAPQPAQTVPAPPTSVRPVRPVQPPPPVTIAPPQPPLAVPRAAAITTCDPAGCWDSEGRRLNNVGPLLMGPRGLCTLHGGMLNCP